jgi:hypothetical protein
MARKRVTKSKARSVRYLGEGRSYILGVPARDLAWEEWLRLPEDVREKCTQTGLYELEIPEDGEKE